MAPSHSENNDATSTPLQLSQKRPLIPHISILKCP